MKHTSHSLWPWKLSSFSILIATTMPLPGLVGARVFSSIHPLKTHPKPPSPRRLLERKFFVAILRSLKLKDFKLSTNVTSLLDVEIKLLDDELLTPLTEDVWFLEESELEEFLHGFGISIENKWKEISERK